MSDTRALVAEAIAATRIHPPARFTWFGVMSPRPAPRAARSLSPRALRDHLVNQLSGRLYADFYQHGRAGPSRWPVNRASVSQRDFEAALSAANCGQGFLDGGWQVRGTDEYGVMVVKNGLEMTVKAGELTRAEGTGPPAAGEWCELRLPKELFGISPGFYMVCGDHATGGGRMVRLYWNLRADGAAPFVAAATRLLNSAKAGFNLKVPNDPNAFIRCDAGVIYLPRDDYPALAGLILELHAEIDGYLSPRTPAFTAELAPGLGFAEDTGTGRSFGEHRCRLLAEALVRSHESGWADDATVLAAVEARFAEAGIDLDAAHLSPDLVGAP
jgi:hypothetical protein